MGSELTCLARYQNREATGKVLLETDEVIFRSDDLRFTIPFKSITSTEVRKDHLILTTADGVAVFDLGAQADVWAKKITAPKSRLEKLGVKSAQSVRVIGDAPKDFLDEITAGGGKIISEGDQADALFLFVENREELSAIPGMIPALTPGGALWLVRPKGSDQISERDVMDAGRKAGLVDVKVVRFSDGQTAEKFVVRKAEKKS